MEGSQCSTNPAVVVLRKPVVPGNSKLELVPRGSDSLNLGSDTMFDFVLIILSHLYPQHGAGTCSPEIRGHGIY